MDASIQNHISSLLNEDILNLVPISGGDISLTYKVQTERKSYFLKVNLSKYALTMFQKEKRGLETIALTKTISTPIVYACDKFKSEAFLLMEYIESKRPNAEDFSRLGNALAKLHQCTSKTFGLKQNNFIGSLYQSNKPNASWVEFYKQERLTPQLQLAIQKGLLLDKDFPSEKIITEKLESLFLDVKPSLLHGDLWNGNYLISKDGKPYLIDPALYYGHYEVDMAMSKLFGGFGESFYKAHSEYFPVTEKTSSRIEIYQLYYLLVHLNLFGKSYYNSVQSIIKKYF